MARNQFCSDRDRVPLFNQTANLTPAMMKKAVGDRLQILADTRKQYDPNDRLLNDCFNHFSVDHEASTYVGLPFLSKLR